MTSLSLGLSLGDPIPWLPVDTSTFGTVNLEAMGGHRLVFFFFGTGRDPMVQELWRDLMADIDRVHATGARIVGVSVDPQDKISPEMAELRRQITIIWDFDRVLSRIFGVLQNNILAVSAILVDQGMRVKDRVQLGQTVSFTAAIIDMARRHDHAWRQSSAAHAPILIIPDVIGPDLRRDLINLWHTAGNESSGYMRLDAEGRAVHYLDASRKVRRDHILSPDEPEYHRVVDAIGRRIAPAIERAFHYRICTFERVLVGVYDSAEGGHFKRHRDFDGPGCHRAFAMSINLNAEEFDGGEVMFPEYGDHLYKGDSGAAVIFSGYLLHEVQQVRRGRRFALLSFLYGEREAQALEEYKQRFGTDYETVRL